MSHQFGKLDVRIPTSNSVIFFVRSNFLSNQFRLGESSEGSDEIRVADTEYSVVSV